MVTIKNRSWRKTTISENIEHVESKGKIKLGQSSNGTKQIMTNPTGSTTSTSTVISHKKNSSCTKIDDINFKRYVEYMLKTNRNRSISEINNASKALIE